MKYNQLQKRQQILVTLEEQGNPSTYRMQSARGKEFPKDNGTISGLSSRDQESEFLDFE